MFASEDKSWFEICEAAVLELDPQKLSERILAAREAINLRLKEIEGDSDHHGERQQIRDALRSLRMLEGGSDAVQEAMSQETSKSSERDWREIAAEAAKETNPERLSQIVKQLCNALAKRHP